MVIDFHTHIFPDAIASKTITALENRAGVKACTDGSLQGLLDAMQQASVDLSVILPVVTKPSQFESINRFAKSVNEIYAGRLLSFGGIHPDSEDYKKELNKIKELGLVGIKLHPDYQGVMIDDIRYMKIIEYADQLGLIIVVHAGIDIGLPEPVHCPPEKMRKVIDVIQPKKMVAAHLGGWRQWNAVYEYLAGENIYFDLAYTANHVELEMVQKIIKKHGADKFLFATDSPWSSVEKEMQTLKKLCLKPLEMNQILYENAKKILALP